MKIQTAASYIPSKSLAKTIRRKFSALALSNLPLMMRRKIYLERCDLLDSEGLLNKVEITLANSASDLEAAFGLIFESYRDCKFIEPEKYKMRVRLFDLLPTTAVIIAKYQERIVGCMILVIDSEFGLPMEPIHSKEVEDLRNQYGKLAEISGLAVHKEFRNNGLLLTLGYAAEKFACEAGCKQICIAVSPHLAGFYEDIILYQQFAAAKNSSRDRLDPLIAMRKNCMENFPEYYQVYGHLEDKYNLYKVIMKLSENKRLMESIKERVAQPNTGAKLVQHFLHNRCQLGPNYSYD